MRGPCNFRRFIATIALIALIALFALLPALADPAFAQTRSPSGRHRPAAPAAPDSAVSTQAAPEAPSGPWRLGVGVGSVGGGDLFRAEATDQDAVRWQSLEGASFASPQFKAGLERNAGFGLTVRRALGPVLSLRADLGYSRLDVAAEALLGQSGAVLLYDRISVLRAGLGLDVRLAAAPSYPFLGLGAGAVRLQPEMAADLEQTVAGVQAVLGYHRRVGPKVGLELEARLGKTGFDVGGFQPATVPPGDRIVEVDSPSSLTFFEITACFIADL